MRRICGSVFCLPLTAALILFWILVIGCKPRAATVIPATAPSSSASPTVASLVPAATDMILGMGLRDHLVAVSSYDLHLDGAHGLPAAGDYSTIDWELLGRLRPNLMILEMDPKRMPAGLQQRADQMGINIHNFDLHRLDDVYARMTDLGDELHEPAKAQSAIAELRRRLDAVKLASAAKPKVSVLIVSGDGGAGTGLIGAPTFLDDLLQIAGGTNVAAGLSSPYPNVDDETLATMKPDEIILLMPDATPRAIDQAKEKWKKFSDMPAVRAGHVDFITNSYALLPGSHLADLAEKFATILGKNAIAFANVKTAPRGTGVPPVLATFELNNIANSNSLTFYIANTGGTPVPRERRSNASMTFRKAAP